MIEMIDRRKFIQYAGAASMVAVPLLASAETRGMLPTRPIPGTDELMPIIGLGNSASFRADDLTTANMLIDIFLDHGGRYVDVGGSSAFTVGKLGREKNASDKLFLGNYVNAKEQSAMRGEIAAMAEAQGKSSLDLIHTRDVAAYRRYHDVYRAMKEDGLARYIGIARSGQQAFDEIGRLISDRLVDFIQINYSLLEQEAAGRLLPVARDNGVAVVINRPFLNGDFFSVVRGKELPQWAADFDCESWAQFSLKFILAHPAVNCVLNETANPKHVIDNLGAGFGRLPDKKEQQRMLELIRSFA